MEFSIFSIIVTIFISFNIVQTRLDKSNKLLHKYLIFIPLLAIILSFENTDFPLSLFFIAILAYRIQRDFGRQIYTNFVQRKEKEN